MPTTVKATSPAALLALVPHLTGYEPRNSLVFVTFAAKQTEAVLRIDLPRSANRAVLKRTVTQALGILCKVPGIDGILPVVYCDEPFGERGPRRDLVEVLIARVRGMGFGLWDVLCRASDGWGSYLEPSVPPGGHPLSDLVAPDGAPPVRGHYQRVPDADEASKAAMKREVDRLRSLPVSAREFEPLDDTTLFLDDALEWDERERREFGPLLLRVLQSPPVRDHTMLQWSTSLAYGDVIWNDGAAQADRLLGMGRRPDPERIAQGIDLLGHLLSLSVAELRPAPLCMLAWLHWSRGSGSIAGALLDEVRAIDEGYGMCEVLGMLITGGRLPEWLFDKPER